MKLHLNVTQEQLDSFAKKNKCTNQEAINKVLKAIIENPAMHRDLETPISNNNTNTRTRKEYEEITYHDVKFHGKKFEPIPKKGKRKRGKRGGRKHKK